MMMMMMMQLSALTLSHGTPIHTTGDLDNMDFYIWYVETRTRNRTGGCPDITNDEVSIQSQQTSNQRARLKASVQS